MKPCFLYFLKKAHVGLKKALIPVIPSGIFKIIDLLVECSHHSTACAFAQICIWKLMNKSHMLKNSILLGLLSAMPHHSHFPRACFYNPKMPIRGLEHKPTILWLLLGLERPVTRCTTIPPTERVEEVAVLSGAVILVVLVTAAHASQGGGPLPPVPPVGWWGWPAGLAALLLQILVCLCVRAIHHFNSDLWDSKQTSLTVSASSLSVGSFPYSKDKVLPGKGAVQCRPDS